MIMKIQAIICLWLWNIQAMICLWLWNIQAILCLRELQVYESFKFSEIAMPCFYNLRQARYVCYTMIYGILHSCIIVIH